MRNCPLDINKFSPEPISIRGRRLSRIALSVIVCGSVLAIAESAAWAQQEKKPATKQTKQLIAKDGWPIGITYYNSPDGQEAPVVVLLHGKGRNRLVWTRRQGFAQTLQNRGFAVVAVDLRKHGQSKRDGSKAKDGSGLKPNDYKAMVAGDLEAVKKFLFDEHQKRNLNMRKTAIIAADVSAPVAINFAASDWSLRPYQDAPTLAAQTPRGQIVQTLILLSPESTAPGLTTVQALRYLEEPSRQVAFMFGVGGDDPQDKGTAKQMFQQVNGDTINKERCFYKVYPQVKLRGTALLGKRLGTENNMLAFLNRHLMGRTGMEWADRRPVYERSN